MEKLEDIRKTIQNSYDQQVPKYINDNVIDVQKEMDKYPAISSLSILDDLPPVPSHLPSPTFVKKKSSTSNSTLEQSNSESNLQESMTSSPSSKYTYTTSSNKDNLSKSSSSSIPPHFSASANTTSLQLPSLTTNIYPQTLEVESWELVKWITQKENPRSVLLLDVRPRDMFLQACIKHKWMVQIEPLVLRKE